MSEYHLLNTIDHTVNGIIWIPEHSLFNESAKPKYYEDIDYIFDGMITQFLHHHNQEKNNQKNNQKNKKMIFFTNCFEKNFSLAILDKSENLETHAKDFFNLLPKNQTLKIVVVSVSREPHILNKNLLHDFNNIDFEYFS